MRFTGAIVRTPGRNFHDGLSTARMGAPIYELVREQHAKYCDALGQCGLRLQHLPPDLNHPDSTFVEDTAILTERGALLTRPGAASREGEVASTRASLAKFYASLDAIVAPGTLEGGDVCEADGHYFIGLSERTNEEGAMQPLPVVWTSVAG